MAILSGSAREECEGIKVTVLHRPGGVWRDKEILGLTDNLQAVVTGIATHPEYLILLGHHTKEATLQAIGGGFAYTATQVTGIDSPLLPFVPSF